MPNNRPDVTRLAVAIVGPLLLFCVLACRHPSERAISALFDERSGDFEELRAMILEDDGIVCVNYGFYDHRSTLPRSLDRPSEFLSSERWQQYRVRFEKLGLDNGICRPLGEDLKQDDRVRFNISTQGLLFAGSSKGIVYTTEEPSPLVRSIDNGSPRSSIIYRRIRDDWYAYYEVD